MYYVREVNVFRLQPDIKRMQNAYVEHVCPYVGESIEFVRHWYVWEGMTREF